MATMSSDLYQQANACADVDVMTPDCDNVIDQAAQATGCSGDCLVEFRNGDARGQVCEVATTDVECSSIVAPCDAASVTSGNSGSSASTPTGSTASSAPVGTSTVNDISGSSGSSGGQAPQSFGVPSAAAPTGMAAAASMLIAAAAAAAAGLL